MSSKSYTIFRVAKLATAKRAGAASDHNYRKCEVPNADERAPHPSSEFLNSVERGYWELAQERLDEAGITPRRKDAVRCVEIVLAASPEWFQRDKQGRAADYSNHDWTKDNLTYLQKTFGEKNVLAFKLHQDEKSPHIHALIVPITEDNRLSGRDVVGRPALRQLQTSYAKAMAEHGLERGVERSQAKHKPMKQFYGQQAQTSQQAEQLVAPVDFVSIKLDKFKFTNRFNPDKWVEEQSGKVNGHFQPLLAAANQRAEVATSLARENAAAKDQVRVLQKQLHTSEQHKQKATKEVTKLTNEVAALRQKLAEAKQQVAVAGQDRERFAVAIHEGRPVPELVAQGQTMEFARELERRSNVQPLVEAVLQRQRFDSVPEYFQQVTGYTYKAEGNGQPGRLRQSAHPHFTFTLAEARADGEPSLLTAVTQAIERRVEQLAEATRQAEQLERARVAEQQQARASKELDLMSRAFTIYHWKPAGKLQACLLVPNQHVRQVTTLLSEWGYGCYGQALGVQGEPHRRDGLTAVYALYDTGRPAADHVTNVMRLVTQAGGEVFEPGGHQTSREQVLRQAVPARSQEQEQPTPTRVIGREM